MEDGQQSGCGHLSLTADRIEVGIDEPVLRMLGLRSIPEAVTRGARLGLEVHPLEPTAHHDPDAPEGLTLECRLRGAQGVRVLLDVTSFAAGSGRRMALTGRLWEDGPGGTEEVLPGGENRSDLAAFTREVQRVVSPTADLVHYVSPSVERLWGISASSLLTDPQRWLEAIIPEDADAVRLAFDGRLAVPTELHYRLLLPDGQVRWMWEQVTPLPPSDGRPARLACIATDVTEQKQHDLATEESRKLDALGRLAGNVAHDFNNTLTGVIGICDALVEGVLDQGIAEDVELIRKLSTRAARFTRQLQVFGRRQQLQLMPTDVHAIVHDTARMLERVIGEDIELAVALDSGLPLVAGDANQLQQVVMNLAVNARDAMAAGGRLTVALTRAPYVPGQSPEAANPGGYLRLSVSDTGVGMEAATRERLFEPFFTTKAGAKGSGLGLATVYGIVRQHQGDLRVATEVGRGTTFDIYLPVLQEAPVVAESRAPVPAAQGAETILVVEDEEPVRRIVERSLRRLGYTVLVASDPHEAEELVAGSNTRIDLLLTDIVMPVRSGFELYERLKQRQPGLVVLYISGYAEQFAGADGRTPVPTGPLLAKPFENATLSRMVREALARR